MRITNSSGTVCTHYVWIPMLGWVMMPHVASFDAFESEIAPSKYLRIHGGLINRLGSVNITIIVLLFVAGG